MDKRLSIKPIIDRSLDVLAMVGTYISALAMVVLVSTFGWLVYGRYVLNDTPTWVEQLALLLIITIAFMSSATGVRERTHLAVDIVPQMCGPRMKLVLRLACDFILGGFGLLMAIYANDLAVFSWYKEIPLIEIPEGVRYIPVVASGVLITLYTTASFISGLLTLISYQADGEILASEHKNGAQE